MNSLVLESHLSTPVYKIIRNAKVSGRIRRTGWLHKMALKGFLSTVEKGNTEEAMAFATQIDSMITVLNGVYKDRWDFDLYPEYVERDEGLKFVYFRLFVEIHFPEVEISNKTGRKHLIRDLLVRFEIGKSDFTDKNDKPIWKIFNVEGTRASLSYEEWFSNYFHSHLREHAVKSSADVFYYDDFCLGIDTEILSQMETLMTEYSPESFEFFLWLVNSMVAWESIEGVPYIKIKEIGVSENSKLVSIYGKPQISSSFYKDYIRPNIENLDVDFVYSQGRFRIVQNKKFERLLHHILTTKTTEYWDRLLIKRIGVGYYGYGFSKIVPVEEIVESLKTNGKMPSYYFRDKEITFKILPLEKEIPEIKDYKVHPKFMNYVATRIEQEIYENTIRKSAIERYYQSSHA